jgi:hypothetical protein
MTTKLLVTYKVETMNVCQEALANARDNLRDPRMNFPKWQMMTPVMESIKCFGTVDGTDTSTSEKPHSVWFKKWATNFRGTCSVQLRDRGCLAVMDSTHKTIRLKWYLFTVFVRDEVGSWS